MNKNNDNNAPARNDRRAVLKGIAGLAAMTLAPGILLVETAKARSAQEPASGKVRWGMLIDTNQCSSGCDKCVTACNQEHALEQINGPKTDAQWIRKVSLKDKTTGRQLSLPLMCQHCASPACADVCPTGASFKRADGIVLVDKHICIGCRYCMMACPYKARSFVHETLENQKSYAPRGKGTVEGCTLCVHRVDRGELPACVDACQKAGKSAIIFGDLNDDNSQLSQRLQQVASSQIRADLGLKPGVRYQGL